MQVSMRVLALFIGLFGSIVAFVVNMLYSLLHFLGRISGITADQSHFFIGTGLAILAFVGAILVVGSPLVGAALLVLATIGLFFIMGWWALLAAPFLVVAAILAVAARNEVESPQEPAAN